MEEIEMGDRAINYYKFLERRPNWEQLRCAFKKNVSRFGGPYFVAGSNAEQDFLRFCQASDLAVQWRTIIEYDGKGPSADRFLFLCLKDDGEACIPASSPGFMDFSASCPGGEGFGLCGRGAKQVSEVTLISGSITRIAKHGMLETVWPNVPRIFLVSRLVAEALNNAGVTGCEIVPTNSADCHQLRITAETLGPVRIGHAQMGRRCSVCGVARMFVGSCERYFYKSDLNKTDLQICRTYFAENVGQFEIINGFPIISQNVFDLLLSLKIKGLDRYTTDPPIKYAVVQVRDKDP